MDRIVHIYGIVKYMEWLYTWSSDQYYSWNICEMWDDKQVPAMTEQYFWFCDRHFNYL